jgi:hypothetical protein
MSVPQVQSRDSCAASGILELPNNRRGVNGAFAESNNWQTGRKLDSLTV